MSGIVTKSVSRAPLARVLSLVSLLMMLVCPVWAGPARPLAPAVHEASGAIPATMKSRYGKLPLTFEQNRGQSSSAVKFLSRGSGYTLFLTPDEAVMKLIRSDESPRARRGQPAKIAARTKLKESVLRMKLMGADPRPSISGLDELPGKSNYFIGHNSSQWRTAIPNYSRVRYEGVYPDIDLVYYGTQKQLEYDWIVKPGANPDHIRMAFQGASRLTVDRAGGLSIKLGAGKVEWRKPVVYQEVAGTRAPVEGQYVLEGKNTVRFRTGRYNHTRPLVIDPVLVYSTYLGGSDLDTGEGIAVDSAGNATIVGYTASVDFPITRGAVQTAHGNDDDNDDVFVTKLNPTGTALVYSTYLGGSSYEYGYGIAVDSSGNATITGPTASGDFPVTDGAFQTTKNGSGASAFVTRLNPTGDGLVYSTYLGGINNDESYAIAVDSAGSAYVTGLTLSTNFPVTAGAFQTTLNSPDGDGFVTKLNPTGTALVYSTFLGGNGGTGGGGTDDNGSGIAVDAAGSAYVTGFTTSPDFPTTAGAFQTVLKSASGNAFVTKLNATGTSAIYSTFLGGSIYDSGAAIAVDSSGVAAVTGSTNSTDFPTTAGAFQTALGGSYDAFVTKVNPTGTGLIYSTFCGGASSDEAFGIALDSGGNATITGPTNSTDFPTTAGAFQTTLSDAGGAFVTTLNATGTTLIYSTYLGGTGMLAQTSSQGLALDASGNVYVTGYTDATDFPITTGAVQPTLAGSYDTFISKLSLPGAPIVSLASPVGIDAADATLQDAVNPNSLSTTAYYQWGLTTAYGNTTSPADLGSGSSLLQVQTTLQNLTPGATYHYSIVATNLAGTTVGDDQTFTTLIAPTTTTLQFAPPTTTFGQPVTLTATVTGPDGLGTPTGTVEFFNGATDLGPGTLDGTGATSLTTSALPVGTASVTASYSGNSSFAPSTSAAGHPVVIRASPLVALTSSANPSAAGQPVTLTVNVSGPAGAVKPTGQVTFKDQNNNTLGTGPATLINAKTSIILTAPPGSYTITAFYSGDTNYFTTTTTATQVVSLVPTTTAVQFTPANPIFGHDVTFTATVTGSPGFGVPTGTVEFFNGATDLGPGTLDGTGATSLTTSALPVGIASITADYSGDATFAHSASDPVLPVVAKATPGIALTSSANPSAAGQPVTLTVTVSGPTGAAKPTGQVTLKDQNNNTLGTGPATLNNGTASIILTAPPGSYTITATYSGDTNYTTASTSATQVVNQVPTTTAVQFTPANPTYGQAVTFTATITASPGFGVPTGTVEFFNGEASLGTAPVDGTGAAALITSALPLGTANITANYSGDAIFNRSNSAAIAPVVTQATPGIALSSSANPSAAGQPVTLTVTVSGPTGAVKPTGQVTLTDQNNNTLGTGPATLNNGTASIILTAPPGSYTITATYSGDTNYTTASTSATQVVNQVPTTTAVQFTPANPTYGQAVTFTATITASPGFGVPTGTVEFFNGEASLGTAPVDGTGAAALITSALPVGTANITANYSGDAIFNRSNSVVAAPVVTQATPTVALSSSANPSAAGQPVTFTITLSGPAGAEVPTGTVTLTDQDDNTINGAATLVNGVATVDIPNLFVGSHHLTAAYSGDTNYTPASGVLTQVVSPPPPAATTTTLTTSANPAAEGHSLTLLAVVVAPGAGTPTGQVTFMDGSIVLGTVSLTEGQAALSLSILTPGAHTLTAVYTGADHFTGSSSIPLSQVINANAGAAIPAGLSMVSLPYDFAEQNEDAAVLFGTSLVATYDPIQNQYLLYPNLPGPSGTMTEPGRGYWVHRATSAPVVVSGSAVASPFSITLQPGWNMIGDPFTTSIPIQTLQVSVPFSVTLPTGPVPANQSISLADALNAGVIAGSIWTYNTNQGAYTEASTIAPFQGYWIFVSPTGAQSGPVTLIFTIP